MTVSSKNIALSAISTVAWLLLCHPAIAAETDPADLQEWNVANFKTTMTEIFSCNFQMSEVTDTEDSYVELYKRMDTAVEGYVTVDMEMEGYTEIDGISALYESQYNCDFTNYDATSGMQAVADKFGREISEEEVSRMMQNVYETQTIELLNRQYSCSFSMKDYDNVAGAAKQFGNSKQLEDLMKTAQDLAEEAMKNGDTQEQLQDLDIEKILETIQNMDNRKLQDLGDNKRRNLEDINMEQLMEMMNNIDNQVLQDLVETLGMDPEDVDIEKLMEMVMNPDNQDYLETIGTNLENIDGEKLQDLMTTAQDLATEAMKNIDNQVLEDLLETLGTNPEDIDIGKLMEIVMNPDNQDLLETIVTNLENIDDVEKLKDLMKTVQDLAKDAIKDVDNQELQDLVDNIDPDNIDIEKLMETVKDIDNQVLQDLVGNLGMSEEEDPTMFMTKFGEDPTFDALCKGNASSNAAMSFPSSFRSFSMILVSVSYLCAFIVF